MSLSARQQQVYELDIQGMSAKRVAYILGISVKTVEHHRQEWRRKMGGGNTVSILRNQLIEARREIARLKREAA